MTPDERAADALTSAIRSWGLTAEEAGERLRQMPPPSDVEMAMIEEELFRRELRRSSLERQLAPIQERVGTVLAQLPRPAAQFIRKWSQWKVTR